MSLHARADGHAARRFQPHPRHGVGARQPIVYFARLSLMRKSGLTFDIITTSFYVGCCNIISDPMSGMSAWQGGRPLGLFPAAGQPRGGTGHPDLGLVLAAVAGQAEPAAVRRMLYARQSNSQVPA